MQQCAQHLPHTGERLKALRLKCGLSQRSLAELVEVHHSTISRWEGEQSFPNSEQFVQLAEVFGEPLAALIPLAESEGPTVPSGPGESFEDLKATILGLMRRVSELEQRIESSQRFYVGFSPLAVEESR